MASTYGPLPILTRYPCSEVVDGKWYLVVEVVINGQRIGDEFENILCLPALAKIGGAAGLCGPTVARRSAGAKSDTGLGAVRNTIEDGTSKVRRKTLWFLIQSRE